MYAGVAGGRTGKSQPVDQGAVTYWHHRRWPRNLFTTVEILSENANFSWGSRIFIASGFNAPIPYAPIDYG
jgi:hypothetical protein